MSNTETQPEQQVVAEQVEQPASQPKLSAEQMEMMKQMAKAMVQEAMEEMKKTSVQDRQFVEEQSTKISNLVQTTQASIMKPVLNGTTNVDYVNKVLEEDETARMKNSDGKARYGENPEDLTKAKIIILKKMGLNNEEIAKALFDN